MITMADCSENEKKLDILFVVSSFPTVSETFIVNQIIFLINSGHRVRILAFKKNNVVIHPKIKEYGLLEMTEFFNITLTARIKILLQFLFFKGIRDKMKFLPAFNVFGNTRDVVYLRTLSMVNALSIFNLEFDIVHAHYGFNSEIFFQLKECFWLKNAELVTTFHGHDMKPSDIEINKNRYRYLFDIKSKITTNNEYAVSLLKNIRRDYSNIDILPVSLDTQYFKPTFSKKSSNVVLFCGRLISVKGPNLVIEIANQLINHHKFKEVKFVIVGEGPEEAKLRQMIRDFNLMDHVILKGALDQTQVKEEMELANVFILPGITDKDGRAENQGLVIQEAQAMELPVIVSDAGGMKYGLIEGKTGYVLPQGNIAAFVEKTRELLENPGFAKQMGKLGRDFVIENYDFQVGGKRLLQIYNNLKQKENSK